MRWMHPTRGLLSPSEFLDVAEETGLIITIGAQVLDQVCALLAACPVRSASTSRRSSCLRRVGSEACAKLSRDTGSTTLGS